MPLRKKGLGRAIHCSGFIIEQTGLLKLSQEEIDEQEKLPVAQRLPCYHSKEIIYPGKNGDGWWNCERLVEQVSTVLSSS